MFETELLRSFVTVAEAGGFTRAAELLNSTQSTVSAQIRRLEERAGQPLFARSTRIVTLTSAGETLLGYARTILQLNEDAKARLSGSNFSGSLRIGVAEDLTGGWLPQILRRYGGQNPGLRLELEVGIGPRLFQLLDDGALDLVIGGTCQGDTRGWRLWLEPLVWGFADQGEVPTPLPLAFLPEPCPYRDAALLALAAAKRDWRIACISPSMAGIRAAVLAGLAATPLPRSAVGPGLRILEVVDGLPDLPDVDYVIRCATGERRKPVLALAELIRTSIPTMAVPTMGTPATASSL